MADDSSGSQISQTVTVRQGQLDPICHPTLQVMIDWSARTSENCSSSTV